MSFVDSTANSGNSARSGLIPMTSKSLWDSLASDIFTLSSNVSNLTKLTQAIGSTRDTPSLRNQIHELTQETREGIRKASNALKTPTEGDKRMQKKLASDFEAVLVRFQHVSRLAAERSREYVSKAKAVQSFEEEDESHPLLQTLEPLDSQVDFNEALIAERETDLVHIEQSIQEVNEIFRDLGTIVSEQQYLLDNIESNVSHVAIHLENATSELTQGERHQRSNTKCKWYIFAILTVLVLIMIVLILRPWSS